MSLDEITLDQLFREAKAAMRATPSRTKTPPPSEAPSLESALASWTRTRGVALVHKDTLELIGNFSEYTSKHLPGARRLVRETTKLPFYETEYVSGVWGKVQIEKESSAPRLVSTHVDTVADVILKEMHVQAPQVLVTAHFTDGQLSRVCLRTETTFSAPAGPEGTGSFCILPPGTNILAEMSIHSIRALLSNLQQPV